MLAHGQFIKRSNKPPPFTFILKYIFVTDLKKKKNQFKVCYMHIIGRF